MDFVNGVQCLIERLMLCQLRREADAMLKILVERLSVAQNEHMKTMRNEV